MTNQTASDDVQKIKEALVGNPPNEAIWQYGTRTKAVEAMASAFDIDALAEIVAQAYQRGLADGDAQVNRLQNYLGRINNEIAYGIAVRGEDKEPSPARQVQAFYKIRDITSEYLIEAITNRTKEAKG